MTSIFGVILRDPQLLKLVLVGAALDVQYYEDGRRGLADKTLNRVRYRGLLLLLRKPMVANLVSCIEHHNTILEF